MTLEVSAPECAEYSRLLQPFIDGELSDRDQDEVGRHLEQCEACRSDVQQQQTVRATLRELSLETAPDALLLRIRGDLDVIDRERAEAANEKAASASILGRIRAFSRGGMLMVPAAAAAVVLFWFVRENAPAPAGVEGSTPASLQASSPTGLALPSLENARSGTFPIQMPGALSDGVELVSNTGNADEATVHFRHRHSSGNLQILDRQRRLGTTAPRGREQGYQDRQYFLSRGSQGEARVEFEIGGIVHRLELQSPVQAPRTEHSANESDFAPLLRVGHALRSSLEATH